MAAAALQNCSVLTMPNLHALLYVCASNTISNDSRAGKGFSKVEKTASCIRNMGVERLESLILLQAHTDKTPSTDDVLDCFASNSARRFNLMMSLQNFLIYSCFISICIIKRKFYELSFNFNFSTPYLPKTTFWIRHCLAEMVETAFR